MASFLARGWHSVKPSYHARRGIVLAMFVVVLLTALIGGWNLQSGFGRLTDLVFVGFVAATVVPIAAMAIGLLLVLARNVPVLLSSFFIASAAFVVLNWFGVGGPALGWALATIFLFVECALGSALATILRGGLHSATSVKRAATWSILAASLTANVGFAALLIRSGEPADPLVPPPEQRTPPPKLLLEDPSRNGPFPVKTLYYGSGDSLRRPEYGSGVALRTKPVDATAFFKGFHGWRAWLRKRYWGFGVDKLPLNARVSYPAGPGPFPLFVIVHGNHNMSARSDRGYDYLCDLLASRGFIAVSVDENFLNLGFFQDPPKQQSVRGWLLLEHLRLWHVWAHNPGNPFFGKVDLGRIALAGHSRGGEAAATAALFNKLSYFPDDATIPFRYGFQIKAVVAISAVDGQYQPAEQPRMLNDINYLALQGANDSDLTSFSASRQYDRVHFSGTAPAFKSELFIYRANHSRFNSEWGAADQAAPGSWLLNARALLPAEAQRQILMVYVSAFLESVLHDRSDYRDLFRDYRRGRAWLPATSYLNRFQDQTYKNICSFTEDADLATTTLPGGRIHANGLTVWREGRIPTRDGNREYNGVFLGWNWSASPKPPAKPPTYGMAWTGSSSAHAALNISVAITDEDAPGPGSDARPLDDVEEKEGYTAFSIEADDDQGARARVSTEPFALLPPPFHVQFTKLDMLDRQIFKSSAEPVFQSIRIPLQAFVKANPLFDSDRLRQIQLIFDRTPTRVIIISGIGLDGR